jgi:hypothetical protein
MCANKGYLNKKRIEKKDLDQIIIIVHTICLVLVLLGICNLCTRFRPGLPNVIFSKQKSNFSVNFGGTCIGILNGHWVYFTAIGYILWPFGIFHGYLVYISRFGLLHEEISGNPASGKRRLKSRNIDTDK